MSSCMNEISARAKSKKNKLKKGGKKYNLSDPGGDDFPSMMTDMFFGINWRVAFFMYIFMIFIFSDIYIDLFLSKFKNAVEGDCPTTKGTLIQITIVIIFYIILDLLVQGEFI